MLLELRFSVWTLSLTAGTFIAALYGMNLASGIEEHEWGFWGVSGVCGILAVGVWWGGIRRLRVVQRLTMWGHGGGGKSKWLSPWGLGGRGRRSSASRAGDRFVGAAGLAAGETMEAARAVRGLRAGENFGDLVKRERVVAKRLAQAEARMDQAAKGEL
jgi:magnesium transporter